MSPALAGRVEIMLEGGARSASMPKAAGPRYGPYGGGLNEVTVRTDDGREGTAIYEVTGAHHHRFFPVPRADGLPG